MKKPITYLILFFFPFTLFAQRDGNIFAEVDSNYVTLWQTNTSRNCGCYYTMDVTTENLQIDWYQINIGDGAFCMCNFDLSVTIGPLLPGNYNTDVFSRELSPDTIYQGSTSFTIETPGQPDPFGVVDEFQSDCDGAVGVQKPGKADEKFSLKVFPNPAQNSANLTVISDKGATLAVYNSSGQIIQSFQIEKGKQIISWNLSDSRGNNLLPGYYFLKLKTDKCVLFEKLIVL